MVNLVKYKICLVLKHSFEEIVSSEGNIVLFTSLQFLDCSFSNFGISLYANINQQMTYFMD